MSDQPICDRIITYNNKTAVIPGYEGIPQNLLINAICWIILILIFSFLRRAAWDYGRIAMKKVRKNRWTSIFYSEIRQSNQNPESADVVETHYPTYEFNFCSWLVACFTLKNADIQRKAGIDAVQYLRFQLYLIIYTAVTMVLCLAVILPLNVHGDLKSPDLQEFGVTTISNISARSSMLWSHLSLGFTFFIFAIILMQHFARRLLKEQSETQSVSRRTLMIAGISRSNCHRKLVIQHFMEAFPDCEIKDIQICFDVRNLVNLDNQWEASKLALQHSKQQLQSDGVRPFVIPRRCGWCCYQCQKSCSCRRKALSVDDSESLMEVNPWTCRCYPDPVDAITYYETQSEQLKIKIEVESKIAMDKKIGIAFVTFTTEEAARRVFLAYHSICDCLAKPPNSRLSNQLRSSSWTVDFAPTPNNIIWVNLSTSRTIWWIKASLVNLVVFLVVFFLTTPTYVLNLVNKLQIAELLHIHSSFVNQFIPSVILWAVSALLPLLVYRSDRLLGHWTRSAMHCSVMVKTFILLILMVLILPSLGLTSIPALLELLFPQMRLMPFQPPSHTVPPAPNDTTTDVPSVPLVPIGPQKFQWQCVFMPDNGAFFVNYVITAGLIGSAMELVRLPELLTYALRMLCVRSAAEKATAFENLQSEFDFGVYYAWTLCVFAVVSAYSILCPLITPFGLVYLILRHLVERHNLFFTYLPSRIDSRIHWLAMNFMLFSVLLLQLNLSMFIALRIGDVSKGMATVTLALFCLTVFMWLFALGLGWLLVGSSMARNQLTVNMKSVHQLPSDTVREVPPPKPIEAEYPGVEVTTLQRRPVNLSEDTTTGDSEIEPRSSHQVHPDNDGDSDSVGFMPPLIRRLTEPFHEVPHTDGHDKPT